MIDAGGTPMQETGPDEVKWVGKPSQVLNLLWGLLAVAVIAGLVALETMVLKGQELPSQVVWFIRGTALIPVLWWAWNWLVIKTVTYTLSRERLKIRRGPINFRTNEIELYRVRDFRLLEPIWLRPFGLSSIVVVSADKSKPFTTIKAVPEGAKVMEDCRNAVQKRRVEFGTRDIEIG